MYDERYVHNRVKWSVGIRTIIIRNSYIYLIFTKCIKYIRDNSRTKDIKWRCLIVKNNGGRYT